MSSRLVSHPIEAEEEEEEEDHTSKKRVASWGNGMGWPAEGPRHKHYPLRMRRCLL